MQGTLYILFQETFFKLMDLVEKAREDYRKANHKGRMPHLDNHHQPQTLNPTPQETPDKKEKNTATNAVMETKLQRSDYQTILLSALLNTPYMKDGAASPPDTEEEEDIDKVVNTRDSSGSYLLRA